MALLAIILATTVFGCDSPLSIAVENRDSVGYLLRLVDGQPPSVARATEHLRHWADD